MTPLRILLIGNLSDTRCGFANFTNQMIAALTRDPRVHLGIWDGTYPQVYARQQVGAPYIGMFPTSVNAYDVVHLVWNAMTMNHYAGAPWGELRPGLVTSWWDGGPSDASCPFIEWMQVRWSDYPRDGYQYMWYPVPDWVTDLPDPDPEFTVGASSVRGDGVAEARDICARHGWKMNLPTPGQWLTCEDEIRRLAKSTVNVCWYNTAPLWHNRGSAPSMLLAAKRPILINQDPLVAHLHHYGPADGVYQGKRAPEGGPDMEACLNSLAIGAGLHLLHKPVRPFSELSWSVATEQFIAVWEEALGRRPV